MPFPLASVARQTLLVAVLEEMLAASAAETGICGSGLKTSFCRQLLWIILLPTVLLALTTVVRHISLRVLLVISGFPLLVEDDHLLKNRCSRRKRDLHRDVVNGQSPSLAR